jgi:hypothetical protein
MITYTEKKRRIREIESEINFLEHSRPGKPVESSDIVSFRNSELTDNEKNRIEQMRTTQYYIEEVKKTNAEFDVLRTHKKNVQRLVDKGLCVVEKQDLKTVIYRD